MSSVAKYLKSKYFKKMRLSKSLMFSELMSSPGGIVILNKYLGDEVSVDKDKAIDVICKVLESGYLGFATGCLVPDKCDSYMVTKGSEFVGFYRNYTEVAEVVDSSYGTVNMIVNDRDGLLKGYHIMKLKEL